MMKTTIKIAIVTAIVMMLVVPFAFIADASDGDVSMKDQPNVSTSDNMGVTNVTITLTNTGASNANVTVYLKDPWGSHVYGKTVVDVPPQTEGSPTFTVTVGAKLSAGDHFILVKIEGANVVGPADNALLEIHISESIWSKWTTYAAAIVVIIIIGILVYLKVRNSTAKNKNAGAFTAMEAERKANTSIKQKDVEESASATTDKQEYKGRNSDTKRQSKRK